MKAHLVVGLMSGTSLDGLDIALVSFRYDRGWQYEVKKSQAVAYGESLKKALSEAIGFSGLELKKLDVQYGEWLGDQVSLFLNDCPDRPELIVSHGHTIFHQPEAGITLQIGDGYRLMAKTGIKTICDLRSLDVALGGQGAPLVPIGDKMLFPQYNFCLNLGGFSNISTDGRRIAYDICPVNTVLNFLAEKLGHPYDKNGSIARSGKPLDSLLALLNNLPYYKLNPPKSLGIEWVNSEILPLLNSHDVADLMHTYCLHIAQQISAAIIPSNAERQMLVTGGGTKNTFLMEMIKKELGNKAKVVIPDHQTVDFKEAIIFGFLGLLRMLGEVNTLRSVTGASADSSGGLVFDHIINS